MEPTRHRRWLVPSVVALAVLLRLPLLLSGDLVPDGDECVVGLMALDVLDGRAPALWFSGQAYAFAVVESLLAALAFAVFGVSTLALKGAMLVLFLVGLAFLASAARRLLDERAAWVVGLLLAAAPAWGAWSLKARGGYLTAFACAQLGVWLVARGAAAPWLGLVAGVVALAQPLWLLVLGPFLLRRGVRGLGVIVAVAAAVVLTARLAPAPGPIAWDPRIFGAPDVLAAAAALPERLAVTLGGAFVLGRGVPLGPLTAAAGWTAAVALLVLVPLTLAHRRRFDGAVAGALGATAVMAATLAMAPRAFQYRYLLPVAALLPWLAGALPGRGRLALALALGLLGAGALAEQRALPHDGRREGGAGRDAAALARLVDELDARGVRHVYSLGPLLQWQVMFASEGRVLARWTRAVDRRPDVAAAVDAARAAGAPVALVGKAHHGAPLDEAPELAARRVDVGGRYFLFLDPEPELLAALGFRSTP